MPVTDGLDGHTVCDLVLWLLESSTVLTSTRVYKRHVRFPSTTVLQAAGHGDVTLSLYLAVGQVTAAEILIGLCKQYATTLNNGGLTQSVIGNYMCRERKSAWWWYRQHIIANNEHCLITLTLYTEVPWKYQQIAECLLRGTCNNNDFWKTPSGFSDIITPVLPSIFRLDSRYAKVNLTYRIPIQSRYRVPTISVVFSFWWW